MRTLACAPLGRDVSALGFGTASLGSRVAPAVGLRALAAAFERGITWYDTAPAYGDGQSEAILGQFLAGKRDRIVLCSKFGIARPATSLKKELARQVLRPVVKLFPQIRGALSRGRGAVVREPIDPARIEASVVESLRLLKTDYLDILALHEPSPADVCNDAVLRALEDVQAKGLVRAVSIAGSPDSAAAGLGYSRTFRFAQFHDDPFEGNLRRIRAAADAFFVTHSVFGGDTIGRTSALLAAAPDIAADLTALGYHGGHAVADALLDYALNTNAGGVVLSSMYSAGHLDSNCARGDRPLDDRIVAVIDRLVQASSAAA